MSIDTLVKERIEQNFEKLKNMEVGTEEYNAVFNETTRLLEQSNYQVENEFKLKELKENRVDRIVKNCLTGVSIVGGFVLTVWGTFIVLDFEKEGTVTTTPGRRFLANLFLKK